MGPDGWTKRAGNGLADLCSCVAPAWLQSKQRWSLSLPSARPEDRGECPSYGAFPEALGPLGATAGLGAGEGGGPSNPKL